jgi:hypothetical protein
MLRIVKKIKLDIPNIFNKIEVGNETFNEKDSGFIAFINDVVDFINNRQEFKLRELQQHAKDRIEKTSKYTKPSELASIAALGVYQLDVRNRITFSTMLTNADEQASLIELMKMTIDNDEGIETDKKEKTKQEREDKLIHFFNDLKKYGQFIRFTGIELAEIAILLDSTLEIIDNESPYISNQAIVKSIEEIRQQILRAQQQITACMATQLKQGRETGLVGLNYMPDAHEPAPLTAPNSNCHSLLSSTFLDTGKPTTETGNNDILVVLSDNINNIFNTDQFKIYSPPKDKRDCSIHSGILSAPFEESQEITMVSSEFIRRTEPTLIKSKSRLDNIKDVLNKGRNFIISLRRYFTDTLTQEATRKVFTEVAEFITDPNKDALEKVADAAGKTLGLAADASQQFAAGFKQIIETGIDISEQVYDYCANYNLIKKSQEILTEWRALKEKMHQKYIERPASPTPLLSSPPSIDELKSDDKHEATPSENEDMGFELVHDEHYPEEEAQLLKLREAIRLKSQLNFLIAAVDLWYILAKDGNGENKARIFFGYINTKAAWKNDFPNLITYIKNAFFAIHFYCHQQKLTDPQLDDPFYYLNNALAEIPGNSKCHIDENFFQPLIIKTFITQQQKNLLYVKQESLSAKMAAATTALLVLLNADNIGNNDYEALTSVILALNSPHPIFSANPGWHHIDNLAQLVNDINDNMHKFIDLDLNRQVRTIINELLPYDDKFALECNVTSITNFKNKPFYKLHAAQVKLPTLDADMKKQFYTFYELVNNSISKFENDLRNKNNTSCLDFFKNHFTKRNTLRSFRFINEIHRLLSFPLYKPEKITPFFLDKFKSEFAVLLATQIDAIKSENNCFKSSYQTLLEGIAVNMPWDNTLKSSLKAEQRQEEVREWVTLRHL